MPQKRITFLKHLEELRSGIIKSLVVLIVVSGLVYKFSPSILSFLIKPVGKVVFIIPTEGFMANVTVAILAGVLLSSPFIIYQIWKFIYGGLKRRERRYILLFGILSFSLFSIGCGFGYFVVLPVGFKFLLNFATPYLQPMIAVSKYISFVGGVTFLFGIVFQLPLAVIFLTHTGIVNPLILSRRRKEVIAAIFILAALITPPDIITQVLLALPLIVIYEISIVLSKIIAK